MERVTGLSGSRWAAAFREKINERQGGFFARSTDLGAKPEDLLSNLSAKFLRMSPLPRGGFLVIRVVVSGGFQPAMEHLMTTSTLAKILLSGVLIAVADAALASTTGTGIAAGFGTLNAALDGLIKGAGGYLILILSVIVGGVTLALTGRWTLVIVSLAVGLFLGYGITIIKSVAGITATTEMISVLDTPAILPAAFDAPAHPI